MKTCGKCSGSLDRGEVTYYKGDEIVEVLCYVCAKARQYNAYAESKVLTTSLLIDSALIYWDLKNGKPLQKGDFAFAKHALQIAEDSEKLQALAKRFEKEVWFAGLQELLSKSTMKGASAYHEDLGILTYCMCGRCMITFEVKNSHSVTLITDETSNESRTGIQGVCATLEQASDLIINAIQAYRTGMLDFKEDREVRIAGL